MMSNRPWGFKGTRLWQLGVLLLLIAGQPVAEAQASWSTLPGRPLCGGIVNGVLQPACEDKPATFQGKAVGTCPQGTFFDIGTWSCYTCPSGYNRTGFGVDSDKACSKNIPDVFGRASYISKAGCPSGSFFDIRNGGECWQCPSGFGRTAAPVDQWNACGRIGSKAVSANFRGKPCPSGFGDPRNGGECWKCPDGMHRTGNPVTGERACVKTEDLKPAHKAAALTCPAGQDFDFIDGGTCWSCPSGYKRTMAGVKTPKACRSKFVNWEAPKPPMPGIFGIQGAEAVIVAAIKDRAQLDELIEAGARAANKDVAISKQEEWNLINNKPWESPVLNSLVLEAVVAAAEKPESQRSQVEKDLVNSVSYFVQEHRLFVATQAKQAFDNAIATDLKIIEERTRNGLHALAGGNPTAPDYNYLTQAMLGVGGAGTVGAGLAYVLYVKPANIRIFPYRELARKAASKAGQKIIEKAGVEIAKKVGAQAVKSIASVANVAAGPFIIITGAVLIAQMELDKVMQTAETEGKIRQAIDQARQPFNLGVFLQREDGFSELMYHWTALSSGTTRPSPLYARSLGDEIAIDPAKVKVTGTVSQMPANASQPADRLGNLIQQDVLGQPRTAPQGAMRIEGANRPDLCIAKKPGTDRELNVAQCRTAQTLWIVPDTARNLLLAAGKYCLLAKGQTSGKSVTVAPCPKDEGNARKKDKPEFNWQLTPEGMIRQLDTDQCMTLMPNMDIALQKCGSQPPLQTWRPWAGR